MKRYASEIADDDVARDFFVAMLAGEVLNVAEGLRLGFDESFATAFVFDENDAAPEEVDVAVIAGKSANRFFKAGNGAAGDAEDVEKFVPEGLLFGLLALDAGPFFGEGDGAVANFVPGERHGSGDVSKVKCGMRIPCALRCVRVNGIVRKGESRA